MPSLTARSFPSSLLTLLAACAAPMLAACGGGDDFSPYKIPEVPAKYTVGGTISGQGGLSSGASLVLVNGTDTLNAPFNGAFAFQTLLLPGTPYDASIKTQPAGYNCQLQNGKGTVGNAAVSNITVSCTPNP